MSTAQLSTKTETLLTFTKLHGLGNDFIMLTQAQLETALKGLPYQTDVHLDQLSSLAAYLCDRHFGIGADGIIVVAPPSAAYANTADVQFVYYNGDGSRAEMCGNGIRCFANFIWQGDPSRVELKVETPAGLLRTYLDPETGDVKVSMGPPRFLPEEIPFDFSASQSGFDQSGGFIARIPLSVLDRVLEVTAVSMGNPHAILFSTDLDPAIYGPAIETHPAFPAKTNVEFVEIISQTPERAHLKVVVWERGCGFTLACGTGACAVAVAARRLGLVSAKHIAVELPGGVLDIEWDPESPEGFQSEVWMRGPVKSVFEGQVKVPAAVLTGS